MNAIAHQVGRVVAAEEIKQRTSEFAQLAKFVMQQIAV